MTRAMDTRLVAKYLITEEVAELVRAPVESVRYWRHIGKARTGGTAA